MVVVYIQRGVGDYKAEKRSLMSGYHGEFYIGLNIHIM